MSDSNDGNVRFAKLNDTNYAQWSVRMEAVLIRKGLWDMVAVDPPTEAEVEKAAPADAYEVKKAKRGPKKMQEARAELILAVEDSQLAHMRSRDPLEIWDTLAQVHRARGFAMRLALRRQFLTAMKKPKQSMQAWIGDVKGRAFQLEDIGVTVSDEDIILVLTMDLPASFEAVVIALDSIPSDQLTLEYVISRLLNEEARQVTPATTRPRVKTEPSDEALAVTLVRRRTPLEAITCFSCQKKGHYQADCPMKKETAALMVEEDSEDDAW